LTAVEVKLVEGGEDAFGEAGDAEAQAVLAREIGAAVGELGVFGGELVASGGERGGAAGELVEVQQRGLVGIEQPTALELGLVELALERGELSADQVVIVGRCGGDDGVLAGEQLRWLKERAADLVKDVAVELVGADVALGAAQVFAAGAQDVVVAAVVVTVKGAVAAAHLVAVAADVAVAALDQPAQQPVAGLDAARAPFRVLASDVLGAVEGVVVDDAGDRDRDPFLAWTVAVARLGAARAAVRGGPVDRLAAVVVDAADVGLIGQQALQRRGAPERLAGRRGMPRS
jgi:hypothetical protein